MKSVLFPSLPILVVDDEKNILKDMDMMFRSNGINNIMTCFDSREVVPVLSKKDIGVILLDLFLPHISGEELLSMLNQNYPDIPVIIITGNNDVETAVRCIKFGASDYIVKPIDKNRLIQIVKRAVELRELELENIQLRSYVLSNTLNHPEVFSAIVTNNIKMRYIFQYAEAIAKSYKPVVITGETGVGKELIARALHTLSKRIGKFIPINVAGLDDTLFSDTLFGHRKGAFTGAGEAFKGLVEQAAGGTLFLDEIADLSHVSQVKLLRLLQEHEYYPLGSDVARPTDARVITSTNENLRHLQKSGRYRKDLYYRLCTHHIHVPPLRERLDDLPLLVDYFLEETSRLLNRKKPAVPKELLILLSTYQFPGNVRELQSMIYDAVSSHGSGKLSLNAFKSYMNKENEPVKGISQEVPADENSSVSFPERLPTIRKLAEQLVIEAIRRTQGNQSIAARLLGISQQALSKRLKQITN